MQKEAVEYGNYIDDIKSIRIPVIDKLIKKIFLKLDN